MTRDPADETQKTDDPKHTPPRVAKGPPPTREGERQYGEEALRDSADYAEERSDEAPKPYATETEAWREAADRGGPVDRTSPGKRD